MMQEMNDYQKVACKSYAGGAYAHLIDNPDWYAYLDTCGDTLFRFVIIELSDSEGCEDWYTAIQRMNTAARQVEDLACEIVWAAPDDVIKPRSTSCATKSD